MSEDTEQATAPSPRARKRWEWLASIVVVGVLAAGVLMWLLQATDPEFRPPVVEGLTEPPDYAWQRALQTQLFAVAGDAIVTYPETTDGDDLALTLVNAADGAELWSVEVGEDAVPGAVEVHDLRATDYLAVTIRAEASGASGARVLLVSRSDGSIGHSFEIPPNTGFTSSNAGSYLLLGLPEDGVSTLALLGSPDPQDVRWSTEIPPVATVGSTIFREHKGYLAISIDVPGLWWPGANLALSTETGELAQWSGRAATIMFVDDLAVVPSGGDLMAYRLDDGEVAWAVEGCECTAYEIGGQLFQLTRSEGTASLMRLNPADGAQLWEQPVSVQDYSALRLAGERLVVTAKPDGASAPRTCLAELDAEEATLGQLRCHAVGGFLMWGGQDQLILWDYETLAAAGLDEDGVRWSIDLAGQRASVQDVAGRLLVYRAEDGVVGVLE